jgi:hypothetical protein
LLLKTSDVRDRLKEKLCNHKLSETETHICIGNKMTIQTTTHCELCSYIDREIRKIENPVEIELIMFTERIIKEKTNINEKKQEYYYKRTFAFNKKPIMSFDEMQDFKKTYIFRFEKKDHNGNDIKHIFLKYKNLYK